MGGTKAEEKRKRGRAFLKKSVEKSPPNCPIKQTLSFSKKGRKEKEKSSKKKRRVEGRRACRNHAAKCKTGDLRPGKGKKTKENREIVGR